MITVIMANYNCEKYISESIESVLNQVYDEFEFLIIDDGSEDRSKLIISEFHEKYPNKIIPIYLNENLGQGNAFNIGISKSKGDIISFIDSDDIWFTNKLSNVSNSLKGNDDIALLQHNMFIIEHGALTKKKFKNILISGDYLKYAKQHIFHLPDFIPTSGLSFPKKILERAIPIPIEFKTCADGYLTHTTFCYGEIVSTNLCLGAYRIHKENSIYNNPNYNTYGYMTKLLIPFLNKFYKINNIDYKIKYFILITKILFPFISRFTKSISFEKT